LKKIRLILVVVSCSAICIAGPYNEPGISMNDPNIVSWAVDCNVVRGYIDISNPGLGQVNYGSDANAVGQAEGLATVGVVSLGDAGVATLTFGSDIYVTNGEGDDFTVFENANSNSFLELGFVEVSSDGVNFFQFNAVSLTPTNVQIPGFGTLDATDVYNLAGKYARGIGTGFDLEELKDVSVLLDVNSITHVRVIDVVGFVEPSDFYGDGVVNFIDFSIFAAAYRSEVGNANWNEDCDIFREWITDPPPPHYDDPDGVIDANDLQVFVGRWLDENNYSSCDINGHQINDPWPTPFANPTTGTYTGGFDLDAVGVINTRLR